MQLNSTGKSFIRSKSGVALPPQLYFFETGTDPAAYVGQTWPPQMWAQKQLPPQQWQPQPGWQEQYSYVPQYTQPGGPHPETYQDWPSQYPQVYSQPQYAPPYPQAHYQYPQAQYQQGDLQHVNYPQTDDPHYQPQHTKPTQPCHPGQPPSSPQAQASPQTHHHHQGLQGNHQKSSQPASAVTQPSQQDLERTTTPGDPHKVASTNTQADTQPPPEKPPSQTVSSPQLPSPTHPDSSNKEGGRRRSCDPPQMRKSSSSPLPTPSPVSTPDTKERSGSNTPTPPSSNSATDHPPSTRQQLLISKINKPVFLPPSFSAPPQTSTSQLIVKPENLAFGCETEPGAVDTELHDAVVVKNTGHSIFVSFLVPPDDRWTVNIDPPSFLIKKGKEVKFNLTLKVICTMSIDINIYLLSSGAKRKFKILTESQAEFCNKIHVGLASALSTHLNYMDLIFDEPIGEGSFAMVWKGKYHHAAVAIKHLKDQHPTDSGLLEFKREVSLMTQLRHSQIVNFIGAVSVAEKLCLVTEYMPYGSLASVLKNRKGLDWGLKIKIAHDVATGMAYLHGNSMVHRDLKPDNVLVVSLDKNAQTACKVSDFGTSRSVGTRVILADTSNVTASSARQMTLLIGTPTYMAPEILHKQEYGPPADVFSYGVMLWQLYTESVPYIHVDDFYEFVISGQRETIPPECPSTYAQLISSTWSHKPEDRPTFVNVLETLEPVLKKELGM